MSVKDLYCGRGKHTIELVTVEEHGVGSGGKLFWSYRIVLGKM